jgi:hypothetical protein
MDHSAIEIIFVGESIDDGFLWNYQCCIPIFIFLTQMNTWFIAEHGLEGSRVRQIMDWPSAFPFPNGSMAALRWSNVMIKRSTHRTLCTVYNQYSGDDHLMSRMNRVTMLVRCRVGRLRSLTLPNEQIMQGILCVQGPAYTKDSIAVNPWPDTIGIRESVCPSRGIWLEFDFWMSWCNWPKRKFLIPPKIQPEFAT